MTATVAGRPVSGQAVLDNGVLYLSSDGRAARRTSQPSSGANFQYGARAGSAVHASGRQREFDAGSPRTQSTACSVGAPRTNGHTWTRTTRWRTLAGSGDRQELGRRPQARILAKQRWANPDAACPQRRDARSSTACRGVCQADGLLGRRHHSTTPARQRREPEQPQRSRRASRPLLRLRRRFPLSRRRRERA